MTLREHTTTAAGTLTSTAMPLFVVPPLAGALSDRIGGRRIIAFGLTLDGAGRTETRRETP